MGVMSGLLDQQPVGNGFAASWAAVPGESLAAQTRLRARSGLGRLPPFNEPRTSARSEFLWRSLRGDGRDITTNRDGTGVGVGGAVTVRFPPPLLGRAHPVGRAWIHHPTRKEPDRLIVLPCPRRLRQRGHGAPPFTDERVERRKLLGGNLGFGGQWEDRHPHPQQNGLHERGKDAAATSFTPAFDRYTRHDIDCQRRAGPRRT